MVGGAPIVAAMKNMVELRNWVATFDADGHAKVIYMVRDTQCASVGVLIGEVRSKRVGLGLAMI